MPTSAEPTSPDAWTAELTAEKCSPKALIREYLLDHEPEFVRLYKLQQDVRNIELPTLNCMKMTFQSRDGNVSLATYFSSDAAKRPTRPTRNYAGDSTG